MSDTSSPGVNRSEGRDPIGPQGTKGHASKGPKGSDGSPKGSSKPKKTGTTDAKRPSSGVKKTIRKH